MEVECSCGGSIATVRLNRPDKLNAINEDMKRELTAIFGRLRNDEDIRAVVITGSGRAFCAGGDVSTMGNFTPKSLQTRLQATYAMIEAVHTIEKPVIASMRGAVAGIGWSLALACDQLIASDTAYFSQSFKNIGVIPDGGALYFLGLNIGAVRAKELVFSGRRVPSAEALSLGLVNKVVPDKELEDSTDALAKELAQGPTRAFGLGKKLLMQMQPGRNAFFDAELWAQSIAVLSDDHREGARAFVEKRKPSFKGR
jgi:2-(1,2-epoxy-1,2-dihydrophenyl)acetyl-CoA isomerase